MQSFFRRCWPDRAAAALSSDCISKPSVFRFGAVVGLARAEELPPLVAELSVLFH